jgi:hypothetical protein
MIDAAQAVQDAVFAALNVPTVTNIAPVRQHVPEGSKPPMVVIGAVSLSPEGGKSGGLDSATVEVLSYVREPRRDALYELMNAVRTALDDVDLIAEGADLTPALFESQGDDLLEDGQTYEGTQVFSLFVQPV